MSPWVAIASLARRIDSSRHGKDMLLDIDLSHITTADLEHELTLRGKVVSPASPVCWKCKKWTVRVMHYAAPGLHLHCLGCYQPRETCSC